MFGRGFSGELNTRPESARRTFAELLWSLEDLGIERIRFLTSHPRRLRGVFYAEREVIDHDGSRWFQEGFK